MTRACVLYINESHLAVLQRGELGILEEAEKLASLVTSDLRNDVLITKLDQLWRPLKPLLSDLNGNREWVAHTRLEKILSCYRSGIGYSYRSMTEPNRSEYDIDVKTRYSELKTLLLEKLTAEGKTVRCRVVCGEGCVICTSTRVERALLLRPCGSPRGARLFSFSGCCCATRRTWKRVPARVRRRVQHERVVGIEQVVVELQWAPFNSRTERKF